MVSLAPCDGGVLQVSVTLKMNLGPYDDVAQVIVTLRMNLSAHDGALQGSVTSSMNLGPRDRDAPRVIVTLIYPEIQIDWETYGDVVEELGIGFWRLVEAAPDGDARGPESVILLFREMANLHVGCLALC
jgi:hypothetical protein